ncbi:MAG: diacylglycerol kinase family protein [Chitinophagaceae bacterium]|nr:diacylglycerol kinase family protein [Chitinophagaceae bacterium]
MNEYKPFSVKKRSKSFRFAFEGMCCFFKQEHNAILHLLATVAVIVLSIIFPVSRFEIIILAIVTGLVWAAEFFNTAIEKMADLISKEDHPEIKFIKNVAAAAVLVMAAVALLAGYLIFIPKICI